MVLLLVLSLLLGAFFAGCASSQTSGGGTTSEPAESGAASDGTESIDMVYLSYAMGIGWCVQVADAFEELGEQYNINVEIADGNFKPETQLSQLDQYIAKGVDVVACMLIDEGSAQALAERCEEAGVLLLGETTAFLDADGNLTCPCDWLYGKEVGEKETQWAVDNYERLGFDLSDLSKVGFLYITDTTFVEMLPREEGARNVWFNAFPDFPEENVFVGDRSADSGSNMEAGYNQTAAIFTAHPEIEQWIVISFQEDYASGACRAIEDLGLVDNALLVSAGGENVIPEWDNGMTKPWYAACYFTGYDSASIIMEAADKILRQGVAPEDVYPNKDPGQTYSYATFSGEMISFDNYKSIIGQ
jgi:ABC-type sugar transport system substrate-binding protein